MENSDSLNSGSSAKKPSSSSPIKKPFPKKKNSTKESEHSLPDSSVLAQLPARISPSRIKEYVQCPKLFYYKTILKIPTPNSIATARGTLAHTAFEFIFDHPKGERTWENAVAYVRPAWDVLINPLKSKDSVIDDSPEYILRKADDVFLEIIEENSPRAESLLRKSADYRALVEEGSTAEEEFLVSAEQMVKNWFLMENPNRFEPYGKELHLQATTLGVTLHGFIDRLDKVVTQDGEVRWYISDYKTGKVPDARYLEDAFFAMKIYAVLLHETHNAIPFQLRLLYVKEGSTTGIKTLPVDEQMLTNTKLKMSAVWKQIQKSARNNIWETKTSPLCPWCYFQDVCPAFNNNVDGLLPEESTLTK